MKEIDLSTGSIVRFRLGDKHWDVRKPNMREAKALNIELKKEDADESEIMCGFLETLGFPRAVVESLTIDQMMVVVESLMPEKKS